MRVQEERLKKSKKLEETCVQQEKVIQKMEKLLSKYMKTSSNKQHVSQETTKTEGNIINHHCDVLQLNDLMDRTGYRYGRAANEVFTGLFTSPLTTLFYRLLLTGLLRNNFFSNLD